MYLLDTNVISEARKGTRANPGVQQFFTDAEAQRHKLFLSVITVGELRRGIELLHHRNDHQQATQLETWLDNVLNEFQDNIIGLDADICQLWGKLRVPHPENELDKLIAATALSYDLTVVTRNSDDFVRTGVKLINPFT